MDKIKSRIKKILYNTGILSMLHCIKNRNNLTIVMFHRVLDQTDPRYLNANPTYTFETKAFRGCLSFLKKHYNIITLKALEDYYAKNTPLPKRPLIITFDDGWKDNYDYAYPILKEMNIPAALFIATSALNQTEPFWQEKMYGLFKDKQLSQIDLSYFGKLLGKNFDQFWPLTEAKTDLIIEQIFNADLSIAEKIKKYLEEKYPTSDRSFLSTQELSIIGQDVFEIGLHGHTHHPLTRAKDLTGEIRMSLDKLNAIQEMSHKFQLTKALSFPHGRYNDAILETCLDEGLSFCFTSDRCKMPLATKHQKIGRYYLTMDLACDASGKPTPEKIALWLM